MLVLFLSPAANADDLTDLVPLGSVTHTAQRSGTWSDPTLWSPMGTPGAGARVQIPAGLDVVYDVSSQTALDWLRLDGTLRFATSTSTQVTLDTLVVTGSGQLFIGTQASPIVSSATAQVVFVDNGPIDRGRDPKLLGRGLIAAGRVEMWGAATTSFGRVASAPMAGHTQIVLEKVPRNWQVGDTVVIAGARYLGWQWNGPGNPQTYNGTEDELRTILAVAGSTVTVAALAFDHDGPAAETRTYVGNLTRNIHIVGAGGASTPAQQRPHFMVRHHLNASINHAGFYHLGRTDKSIPLDDVGTNPDGSPGSGNNPRGRYPVHFHLGGATDKLSDPAVIRGSAVWGSPGWGIASHDAHALVEDNVSFDVFGAHYVSEIGNELGAFRRNLAIKAEGAGPNDPRDVKQDVFNHDFGHQGHGFWFQGRNLVTEDLIAAGTSGSAAIWFHRSETEDPRLQRQNLLKPFDYGRNRSDFTVDDVPLVHVRRIESFAAAEGFRVIKANPFQGHDMRSQIEDVLAWQVRTGMGIEYTRHYTLENVRLYGIDANSQWDVGLDFGTWVRDAVVENLYVNNFGVGVHFGVEFDGEPDRPDVVLIDPLFVDVNVETYRNFSATHQTILSAASLVHGRLSFTPDPLLSFDLPPIVDFQFEDDFKLEGTKSDPTATWDYGFFAEDNRFDRYDLRSVIEQGYYSRSDGSRFVPQNELISDRLTGDVLRYDFELNIVHPTYFLGPDLGTYVPPAANQIPDLSGTTYNIAPEQALRVAAPGLLGLANDPDADPLCIYVTEVRQPNHGWVSINPNGSFAYFPDPGFVGVDSFAASVTDGTDVSLPRTFYVEVGASLLHSADFESGSTSEWN